MRSYHDCLASFETNVFGPLKVTRAILPHLRERRSGTIVFISSLSGWVGHQFTGAYASSRFALEGPFHQTNSPPSLVRPTHKKLGIVESLHKETQPLSLRTLLIEPSRFRTSLLSATNLKFKQSQISDYEKASEPHGDHLHSEDLKQPGNPKMFVRLVVDLARQEGCAEGKVIPFRLPVGRDAVEEIDFKLRETMDVLRGWNDIITSTDY